jgi:type 1 glutamine amidotransferase
LFVGLKGEAAFGFQGPDTALLYNNVFYRNEPEPSPITITDDPGTTGGVNHGLTRRRALHRQLDRPPREAGCAGTFRASQYAQPSVRSRQPRHTGCSLWTAGALHYSQVVLQVPHCFRHGRIAMLRTYGLGTLSVWLVLSAFVLAAPPQKALIVDGQNGHDWKATTPVLKKLLEETGLFAVNVATSPAKGQDMSGFKPDFAAYQVVISNYQGEAWPEATQKALVDYVKGGGGLVIYHFACASFPEWKEYNDMTGVGWGKLRADKGVYLRWRDGKIVRDDGPGKAGGHGPKQPFRLVVREPNHPITKGLPTTFMHVPDELYGWLRGPAENVTVLATAFAPKSQGGSDEHEPLLFTVSYGKGRVFQNALGHTPAELKSVAFIATFQRGVEWAATGEVTQKAPADFPTADEAKVR